MNQSALNNAVLLKSDLYQITDIFQSDELSHVLQELEHVIEWEKVKLQETRPRYSVKWIDNGLLDQIWCLLNELDYSKFGLKFKHVSLWKDQHPYFIGQHVDNDEVHAAMQIYLSNGPKELGTWFEDIEIPFVQNTGYIMNNRNKLKHGMKVPVPNGVDRYSIYALFDYV
jgi:hypothetical protein